MTTEPQPPAGYVPHDRVNPFLEWFGQLYVNRSEGRLRFALHARPHFSNGRSVHGGVLLSMADLVLGMTVRENGGPAATISLNCDFVAAAQVGDWIEGEAELTRRTRSIVFVRGTLWSGDQILLTTTGIWKPLSASAGTAATQS